MDPAIFRQKCEAMEDFTFTASTGATVTMNFSILRSMTPQERKARRDNFNRLAQEIRTKYAAQAGSAPCG